MKKPLINVADAKTHTERHGDRFEFSMALLAGVLGAKAIGANLTRVPPGKAAFPFHHHQGNEEHFFVISGSAVLRRGNEEFAVKPFDYIVHCAGGPDCAHQLINTGEQELVYLAISTLNVPDVVGYPDSGKTGFRVGADNDSRFLIADAAKIARTAAEYWKDENGDRVEEVIGRADSIGQR